eukprot:gnl/MRDRNA2_/MRDRNA2_90884_c0_seq1.p1 gnl/MRDRNA2_/MRDRNA2_90884_c0~~gnl/MRDRNA2_/MRDRNA2_90884_c0_seq1.p1  ORF type:complete len:275 (+),score=68.95 gnl/MRDRNA2_/MRDRNA2_90884_c0_seq1:86-910(+)
MGCNASSCKESSPSKGICLGSRPTPQEAAAEPAGCAAPRLLGQEANLQASSKFQKPKANEQEAKERVMGPILDADLDVHMDFDLPTMEKFIEMINPDFDALFHEFDKDGDGILTPPEVETLLIDCIEVRGLVIPDTPQEFMKKLNYGGALHGNCRIRKEDFRKWLRGECLEKNEFLLDILRITKRRWLRELTKCAYKRIHINGGSLDIEQLNGFFAEVSKTLGVEQHIRLQVRKNIAAFDKDKNAIWRKEEFQELIQRLTDEVLLHARAKFSTL